MSHIKIWRVCFTCQDYLDYRSKARDLSIAVAAKAKRDGLEVEEVIEEFMLAAHDRHMAGEPLREDGPTRMTDPYLGKMAALLSPGLFGDQEDS